MANNLVFRWPKPLFFMVWGAHGAYPSLKITASLQQPQQFSNAKLAVSVREGSTMKFTYIRLRGKIKGSSLAQQNWDRFSIDKFILGQ